MKKRQTGASAQGVCRVTRKKGCGGKNSKKKKHHWKVQKKDNITAEKIKKCLVILLFELPCMF